MNFQKHSSQKSSGKQNKKVLKYFKIYQPYDENFKAFNWWVTKLKKKSVPCFPEIVFRKHKICAGLDYCLTYLSHHPIKMVFSLLDNAPIYLTIGSWVRCPKEPISIFWSAVQQINCTVNCKTEVLTIGTSQTTTLERNEMHTLRILSRTHYTKVGMCMYIHCTRLRFLIR